MLTPLFVPYAQIVVHTFESMAKLNGTKRQVETWINECACALLARTQASLTRCCACCSLARLSVRFETCTLVIVVPDADPGDGKPRRSVADVLLAIPALVPAEVGSALQVRRVLFVDVPRGADAAAGVAHVAIPDGGAARASSLLCPAETL